MSPWREAALAICLGIVLTHLPAEPIEVPPGSSPVVIELTSVEIDTSGAATVQRGDREIDAVLNSNVLFAKDSAVLLPTAKARLDQIGADVKAAGPGTLQIIGYTDDLGSAQHGLELSLQRAQAVQAALKPYLSAVKVTVEGKGEADPAVPNTSEANRAKNRRVVLRFTAAS